MCGTFGGDEAAPFGGLGLEAGDFRLNFDGLGDLAKFESRCLQDQPLAGSEVEVTLFVLLESFRGNAETEPARKDLCEDEVAVAIRLDLPALAGSDVDERDFRPRDGGAGLIGDAACDGSGETLSKERSRQGYGQ